jgi:hypothetical protein
MTVINQFVFTESASPVLLRFGTMTDHSLLGDFTITLKATLKDWSIFDSFITISQTFTLRITTVCSSEVISGPSLLNDMVFDIKPNQVDLVQNFV